ncbi:MAG TPA: TIGR04282 family arsenosugar biosynthesis glycosyltransferase [Flavisolibacter sp.]|jgi:rSAM/selenodomain-associated transferase 1|nr:TIGR04282 family arsenosugar biosynthesis glycosyltransferase [Flavisolibacter sp.]
MDIMHEKEALIIFVRQPVAGCVKTRLAADIGPEAALFVYRELLAHTRSVCTQLAVDKYLFYVNTIADQDDWDDTYHKQIQQGNDLGERMQHAFSQVFGMGYERVCIIGSDCLELSADNVKEGYSLLQDNDFVIGPAKDGGYYLLGMRHRLKPVFDAINWSTSNVFQQTVEKINLLQNSLALLPVLADIDVVGDLPQAMLEALAERGG